MMRIVKLAFCGLGLLTLTAACTADDGLAVAGPAAPDGQDVMTADREIGLCVSAAAPVSGRTTRDGATSYDYDLLQEEATFDPLDASAGRNFFHVEARNASDRDSVYIDSYVRYYPYATDGFLWQFCKSDGTREHYYWPASSVFDFFAYAPAMSGGAVTAPSHAANGVAYSGFDTATNTHTLTCDLSEGSFTAGNQSGMQEFIYAYEPGQSYADQGETGVTLRFQHPLSAVYLKIESAFQGLQLYTVTFTSADDPATNTYGQGIYYAGTGTCSTDGTTWEHDEHDMASAFTINVSKVMGTSMFIGYIFTKPYLVMPQPLTDREGLEDVVMTLLYKKLGEADNRTITLPITDTIKAWESGKAYIYTLDIGADESITVGVEVEPWNYQGNYTDVGVDKDITETKYDN